MKFLVLWMFGTSSATLATNISTLGPLVKEVFLFQELHQILPDFRDLWYFLNHVSYFHVSLTSALYGRTGWVFKVPSIVHIWCERRSTLPILQLSMVPWVLLWAENGEVGSVLMQMVCFSFFFGEGFGMIWEYFPVVFFFNFVWIRRFADWKQPRGSIQSPWWNQPATDITNLTTSNLQFSPDGMALFRISLNPDEQRDLEKLGLLYLVVLSSWYCHMVPPKWMIEILE